MEDVPDDRLSELRIQQRATLRRSLYRSRSHAILAAVLCVVAAAETIRQAIRLFRVHNVRWAIGLLLASLMAIVLTIFATRRAIALNRECHQSLDEAPTQPPDFSTLSDGSQQWKNLEEIQ